MKTKKLPYGMKGDRVRAILATKPEWDDAQIADKVGCHPIYVKRLRNKMYEPEAPPIPISDGGRVVPIKPVSEPVAEPVVEDELDTVLDKRASTYGSFMQSANIAIRLKHTMHNAIAQADLHLMPDQILALDMIAVKISRILAGNPGHRDSWVDIAGYAKLVADRLEGKVR